MPEEGVEPRELAVELTYRIQPWDRLALQPDLQWIRHPGHWKHPSALAVGLRIEVTVP